MSERQARDWDDLTDDEIRHAAENAKRYEPNRDGSDEHQHKTNGTTSSELTKPCDAKKKELATLLAKHAIVLVGGTARIVNWKRRNLYPGDTCSVLEFISIEGFKQFYSNLYELIQNDDGKSINRKRIPLAKRFLDEADRYSGVIYAPGGERVIERQLNMWRGFGVERSEGKCSLLTAHIKTVLATGDETSFRYIMRWTAWAVQNPSRRAEVALVLVGGKGVGKGVFGYVMLRIFGSHGTHISNRKHLTGGFNMHLAHCSFVFADEAYWPGDKQGEGELKRLITEPTLLIEPKGIDPFTVQNCLHVLIAGNEEWVVPASGDERRYAVFEVSDVHQGDKEYFDALHAEINNGGIEAMLDALLDCDLEGWHPRDDVPKTAGLRRQQVNTLHGVDALVVAIAHDGVLPCARYNKPNVAVTAGEAKGEGFWAYAKRTVHDLRYTHCRAIMSELDKYGCRRAGRADGMRGVAFPPLAELRATIDCKLWPQDWDDQADWGVPDRDF
jgi:hypothetical protein